MNRFTEAADQYLKASSWKDIAVLKFCLIALGMLIGLAMPGRKKRAVAWGASLVFVASYVPLMTKFLPYLLGQRIAIEDIYR